MPSGGKLDPEELCDPRGQLQQVIRSLWPWFTRSHAPEVLAARFGAFLADCSLEFELSAIGNETGTAARHPGWLRRISSAGPP